LGAALIDGLIVFGLAAAISVLAGLSVSGDLSGRDLSAHDHLVRLASNFGAAFIYFPTVMRLSKGRTVGKGALGLRVTRADGRSISYPRAVWRDAIVKSGFASIPVVGLAFAIADAISVLVDPLGRGLHDFAAGTRVIVDARATGA
jgi:uncharacterized RDD family membrane protein YckC